MYADMGCVCVRVLCMRVLVPCECLSAYLVVSLRCMPTSTPVQEYVDRCVLKYESL